VLQRFGLAGLMALMIAAASAGTDVLARATNSNDEGFEFWGNCSRLPNSFEFLPIYLGSESPGFVDLGKSVVIANTSYRALQYTRDKEFGAVRAVTGRWYGGMGADQWPVGTVDPGRQFTAFRVTDWELDGIRYPIDPDCVLTLSTDSSALGLYNVFVRFTEPGVHRLRIFGRQFTNFTFYAPFVLGPADPFGLDGRRVFMREQIGDVLDDQFVHSYELHVGREEDGGGGVRQQ